MKHMVFSSTAYCLFLAFLPLLNSLPTEENPHENPFARTPIIGIITHPTRHHSGHSYIAASYPKWLELGGARSIPIPYDASDELVEEIYGQVDGILLPGGACSLPKSAKKIWELVMAEEGGFPVWGTCLGFEWLLELASGKGKTVLEKGYNAENISLPLIFPGSTAHKSQLFADPTILDIVKTQNVTLNNHVEGIEPSRFLLDTNLTSIFQISTTNFDRDHREFVSTIEPLDPKLHSVFGTQYHPEKNAFEYGTVPGTDIPFESINHSADAIRVSMHLATKFVQAARDISNQRVDKAKHAYTKPRRHPPVYSYETNWGVAFEQVYSIPPASHWDQNGAVEQEVGVVGDVPPLVGPLSSVGVGGRS